MMVTDIVRAICVFFGSLLWQRLTGEHNLDAAFIITGFCVLLMAVRDGQKGSV